MNSIELFNNKMEGEDYVICHQLYLEITKMLGTDEMKIWHSQPVWFIAGNPITGYSKEKKGIRLMFWSGADFGIDQLEVRVGKFKDASFYFKSVAEIDFEVVRQCLEKSKTIQWDYKNIVKRKGQLEKLDL
ncbi:MAG: DUF1801 domain-containing protein [Bacteroidota bacterium]